MSGRDEIQWPPRVSKQKIRRLYQSDAQGLLDEELLDDVGTLLYQRCLAIFTVYEAGQGRVQCPRCERQGRTTIIERKRPPHKHEEVISCAVCGWTITWEEYHQSYKRQQLNLGGAGDAFHAFVQGWPAARTPQAKMTAIDRLIHEFHTNLGKPTKPVAVTVISGSSHTVKQLMEDLAYK